MQKEKRQSFYEFQKIISVLNQPALSAQQIRFVDTIIKYLTVNDFIDPGALFGPPFTDIASNGLIDVFSPEQATEIVHLVERINKNAVAVS